MRQKYKDVHDYFAHTIIKHIDCFMVHHWKQNFSGKILQKISIKHTHQQIHQFYCMSLETKILREDNVENNKSPTLDLF